MKKEIDEYFLKLDEHCNSLLGENKEPFEVTNNTNDYSLSEKLNRAVDGETLSNQIVEQLKFLENQKRSQEIGSNEYFKQVNQISGLCQTFEVIKSNMEKSIKYFDASWIDKGAEGLTLNAVPLTEFEQTIHKAELQRTEHLGYAGLDSQGNEVESNLDFTEISNDFLSVIEDYQQKETKNNLDLDSDGYGWG